MNWIDASLELPIDPGWYPVLICYDSQEGFFPDAAYWDGDWKSRNVTHFLNTKFSTYEAADLFAIDSDPEW